MRWYERTFPTVQDTLPYIKEAANSLSKFRGVKDVLTWGSLAENIDKPKSSLRDINLLVVCSFNSEDMLAIDQTEDGPFGLSEEDLQLQGFNPRAVSFTKGYIKLANFNIDQWVLSKDDKILHWGPVADTMEEWEDLRKQAEDAASNLTGIKRKSLCKASVTERTKWSNTYDETIRRLLCESTSGWYASETPSEEITNQSISILKL